tara:strand:- start:1395 stop:1676 length:282 start_codon:yes stop_codon:yes gene_type:complete
MSTLKNIVTDLAKYSAGYLEGGDKQDRESFIMCYYQLCICASENLISTIERFLDQQNEENWGLLFKAMRRELGYSSEDHLSTPKLYVVNPNAK